MTGEKTRCGECGQYAGHLPWCRYHVGSPDPKRPGDVLETPEYVKVAGGHVLELSGDGSRAFDEANPKDAVGSRKPPTRYVPPTFLYPVARVMELGASKYGEFNWRRAPVRLSVYLEAINRHKDEALEGRTIDPESGQHPTAHIAACCAIILDAMAHGTLINDLPQSGNDAVLQRVIDNLTVKVEPKVEPLD